MNLFQMPSMFHKRNRIWAHTCTPRAGSPAATFAVREEVAIGVVKPMDRHLAHAGTAQVVVEAACLAP
jgi:hypothetical protein